MPKLPFWLQWFVGFLKPTVDAELAKVAANKTQYVADIEQYASKEGGYALGATTAIVNALPSFMDFAKPELIPVVTGLLAAGEGTIANNASAYFDAALAFVTKEVDVVGL
jgi:uncharacterized MAPEG superfamily protein